MNTDENMFGQESMSWLLEIEAFHHPLVTEFLAFKVESVSPSVIPSSVELFVSQDTKHMLVCLDLGWFGRTFRRQTILQQATQVLNVLLPAYQIRVTDEALVRLKAKERFSKGL